MGTTSKPALSEAEGCRTSPQKLGRVLQVAEKLSKDSKKCQGTTLVVPQVPQN
jgi:hypothetical protein